MKKIIILITIALCSLSYAQMNGKWVLNNQFRTYTDSLQYQSEGSAEKDSVWIINFGFNPSAIRIFVKGNANSPADSMDVKFGADVYNESGTLVETLWGTAMPLKDSSWTTVNAMVNDATGEDYSVFNFPVFGKIKISLLNHRGTLATRKAQVTVQAGKGQ